MEKTARLGILMLDTRFPRIVGDVGNADSFAFPVNYRVVEGATPDAIVRGDAEVWTERFIREGQELVRQGCTGLATTCGFLSLVRDKVADACGVPVASSALEQIPAVTAMLPAHQSVGILTISAKSLTQNHLAAAGVTTDVVVHGLDGGHFSEAILANQNHLDLARSEMELVSAARDMVDAAPHIGAILLECTNMPPYAAQIAHATGRPVFSILTYLNWFHAGLRPS
jgi:Asp/Glu/Hydantoin racemase.